MSKQIQALKAEIILVLTDPDNILSHGARKSLCYVSQGLEALAADVPQVAFGNKAEQPAPAAQHEPVALEAVYETIIQWDEGGGKRSRRELARRILALYTPQPQAQPAPQEPVFCDHCGGNDEDPQDHCMDCTRPRWEPVTRELINNQHPWLYEPMWIATEGGTVIQGYYERWQGSKPDRFITDNGGDWAFDFAYVMPIVQPAPPAAPQAPKENQS